MIQDKTRANAWWDNIISNNNMVDKWKGNLRLFLTQPYPFFGSNLFLADDTKNN